MAWLAADAQPDLVSGVAAIEPTGPPYGIAHRQTGKNRCYSQMIRFDSTNKPYGLADIPLTFSPPAKLLPKSSRKRKNFAPLDVTMLSSSNNEGTYMMQDDSELIALGNGEQVAAIRKLVNLQKMPHVVVTSHAGSHSVYDWATACFMEQAGLTVERMKLENFGIRGNGHLMFLETNSDKISKLLQDWIQNTAMTFKWMPPAPPTPKQTVPQTAAPTLDMTDYILPTGKRSQSEIDHDVAMDHLMRDYEEGLVQQPEDNFALKKATPRVVPQWKTEVAESVKQEAPTLNIAVTTDEATPPRNDDSVTRCSSHVLSPPGTIAPAKTIMQPSAQSSSQQQGVSNDISRANRQQWHPKQEAFLAPNDFTGFNQGFQGLFATPNQAMPDAFMGFSGNSFGMNDNLFDMFSTGNQFPSYSGLGQNGFNNPFQPQMPQFNTSAPFANMMSPNTPTSLSDLAFANNLNSAAWQPTNHAKKFEDDHRSPTPDSRMQCKKARN